MLGTLFITNLVGDVIVEKQFRDKISRTVYEDFWAANVATKGIGECASVVQFTRFAFVHTVVNDVVFLAVSSHDQSPLFTVEVLSTIADILKHYLKEVREETVREHFSMVFQLLEELLDHGFPLTTELHNLEELVPPPTLENKVRQILDSVSKKKGRGNDVAQVPWRNPATSYASNEILFDLVERLNVTIDSEGQVVRGNVLGYVNVCCKLSGMPDVLVNLSTTDRFDDVCLHKCVRAARYENDRAVSFVPPDGNFCLMQYRLKPDPSKKFLPPFYVTPQITSHKDGGRINCMVGLRQGGIGLTEDEKNIHKMVVIIPCPPRTECVNVSSCTVGSAAFDASRKAVVWKIGHLTTTTPSLSADVLFGTKEIVTSANTLAISEVVTVDFQVPNYSVSGVRVNAVNVVNEAYKPFKGVKYTLQAGNVEIRTV